MITGEVSLKLNAWLNSMASAAKSSPKQEGVWRSNWNAEVYWD